MDSQYKEVFSTLYSSDYPLSHPASWLKRLIVEPWVLKEELATIREAIDQAESSLLPKEQRLRSDAKYFLLLNLLEMIVVPVRLSRRADFRELKPVLRDDVALLVGEAARTQGNQRLPEISGHAVLDAVATNWRRLKLSDFRIWGEE